MLASPRLPVLDHSVASRVQLPAPVLSTAQSTLGQGLAGGLAAALLLVLTVAIVSPAEIARAAGPGRAVLRLLLLGPAFGVAGLSITALLLGGITLGRVRIDALRHLLRVLALLAVLAPPAYSVLLFTFWDGQAHWPLLLCSAALLPLLIRLCDRLARSRAVLAADTAKGIVVSLLLVAIVGATFASTRERTVAAGPALEPRPTATSRSPTAEPPGLVLLLTIDTLRADHLSSYGYPRNTSPTLDRLAAEGVRFDRLIAASSGSMPALATLITGDSPQRHGVTDQRGRLGDTTTTLAERFSAAGFATIGVVVNPIVESPSGLQQGFDRFERYEEAAATDAVARLLELAPLETGRPLFAWLHLYEPHTPYDPDPILTAGFLEDRHYDPAPMREIDYGSYGGIRAARTLGKRRTRSPRDLEAGYAEALYDGEILAADGAIAELLRKLQRVYQDDEMVVLFSADHGEILAPTAGRLFHQHALEVYQPAIHVPAILWAPGRTAPGGVHGTLACQGDLAPTLLSICGLPFARDAFSGVDLFDEESPRRGCVSQTAWWDDLSLRAVSSRRRTPTYSLVEGEWKLIVRLHSDLEQIRSPLAWLGAWRSALAGFWRDDELYRLDSDPDERTNLIEEEPERAAAMRERLAAAVTPTASATEAPD